MWAIPDGYLEALASSHSLEVTVRSYLSGVYLGTVPFEAGTVTTTSSNRVRRRLELTVPESLAGDSRISIYGTELFVGWTLISGTKRWPEVPVFAGRVEDTGRDRRSGFIRIRAAGRMAQVNDEAFETARSPAPGQLMPIAIRSLIAEVFPTALVVDLTNSPLTVPSGLTWDAGDGSRGEAIDELSLAIAAEAIETPDGNFAIRPVPTIADASRWTVSTGAGGVIVSDRDARTRQGIANRWLIQVERPDSSTPLTQAVQVDSGPLRYGGPFGRVTRTYRNAAITTPAAASATGQAILARIAGLGRVRTLEVIGNPALDGGDVVTVVTGDGTERHIVDTIRLSLTADQATMAVDTRSVASDRSG